MSHTTVFVNSRADLFYPGLIPQRETEPKPEYYCSSNLLAARRHCSHLTPSQRGLHVKIKVKGDKHALYKHVYVHADVSVQEYCTHELAAWQRGSSVWYLLCSRQISATVKPVREKRALDGPGDAPCSRPFHVAAESD